MLGAKECALLGAISLGPIHGYELVNTLRARGYEEWTEISLPSVYRIIAGLERQRLISGVLEGDTGGAPRKRYSLTDRGRRELEAALLHHLENPTRGRSSFDLGIAHLDLLDVEAARAAIESRLDRLHRTYRAMLEGWGAQRPVPWNVRALFVHGEKRYQAEVSYLRHLLRGLGKDG